MVKYLLRVQVARVRFPPKPPFLEGGQERKGGRKKEKKGEKGRGKRRRKGREKERKKKGRET